jgi:hypothetical protein
LMIFILSLTVPCNLMISPFLHYAITKSGSVYADHKAISNIEE